MSTFDMLCRLVERSDIRTNLLDNAAVFQVTESLADVCRSIEVEELGGPEFVLNNFNLPFVCSAIDSPGTCVILSRSADERRKEGMAGKWVFIVGDDCSEQVEGKRLIAHGPSEREPGFFAAMIGCLDYFGPQIGGGEPGVIETLAIYDMHPGQIPNHQVLAGSSLKAGIGRTLHEFTVTRVLRALISFTACMSPVNYVLGTRPSRGLPKEPQAKIRRSHERERFAIVSSPNVKRLFLDEQQLDETTPPRRPHRRRHHWRTLHAERFRQNVGKRVAVRETWIGPTTIEKDNKVYRLVVTADAMLEARKADSAP